MKKKFVVRHWHGIDDKFKEKLNALFEVVNNNWVFEGTLDEFDQKWQGQFWYYPIHDPLEKNIDAYLFVTHKNNFGQC